jgi:AraC-like DNA-binding protein
LRQRSSPIDIQGLAYKEAGPDYRAGPHRQTAWQWYCVVFGRVDQTVDGQVHHLGPLDSVLIPPGALRSPRCAGAAPGYLYAIFRNRRLKLGALARRRLRTPAELEPDLHALVAEISASPGSNTEELCEALLVRLLVGLQRAAAAAARADAPGARPDSPALNARYYQELVARAEAFMRRNLHRQLSRGEVAGAVHVSEPHLARVFRETAGATVVERLTALRLAAAKRLLLESSMSITQIALEVGWGSFSHFSKVFRSAVGVRPSDYRRAEGHVWSRSRPATR